MTEYIQPLQPAAPRNRDIILFASIFVSTFLLAFGIIVGGLMIAPVVAAFFAEKTPYLPQLPISEAREEEFIDIKKDPGKQLYPALAEVQDVAQGNWIRIPSIGVNVPIVLSPSLNDADVLATLDRGAALYPNGIKPGRLGNTFIAAHSTGEPWKGAYRFAFLRINELEAGRLMHVDYEGTRYTYRVTEKEIIRPTPDFRIESGRPRPTLTLMACWPLWSTQKRMLIHAELTNVTKLTQHPS